MKEHVEQHLHDQRLVDARALVDALESGDDDRAEMYIERLAQVRERHLFEELGKLTRELHETLEGFRGDSRLSALARDEIPDAKERLNYVVTLTSQAADRTLTAVETHQPLVDEALAKLDEIEPAWARFRARESSAEEFRQLARNFDEWFPALRVDLSRLREGLSEILLAQDFQDLTGQVIRRVIQLVQDLEVSLVGMIRLSAEARGRRENTSNAPTNKDPAAETSANDSRGHGPAVPGTQDSAGEVVQSQDDVDALLSSLGF
ncbi:MAG: protein phosphatase CheZ [Thioalkalivibrionaceae bacterium]